MTNRIDGLSDIGGRYNAILCDVGEAIRRVMEFAGLSGDAGSLSDGS